MYCTYCGAKMNDDSRFCPNCGAEIMNRGSQDSSTGEMDQKSEENRARDEFFPDDDTLTPDPKAAYEKAENEWWQKQQERMQQERARRARADQQAQMDQNENDQYGQYEQYDRFDQQYGSYDERQYSGIRNPYGMETIDPSFRLGTNFTLLKFVFLGLITIGIYDIVILSIISENINRIAGPYDGRETMHYCLILFIFSWLTLGIVPLIWYHRLSNRIGEEQMRRTGHSSIGAADFWLWGVLGCLIIVGPFIYYWKLLHAMNDLDAHYNVYQ